MAERNRDGCSVILLERKSIDDSRTLFAKGFEMLGLREELEKHPLSCKFIRALVRLILNLLAERAVHSFFFTPCLQVFSTFSISLVSSDLTTKRGAKLWQPTGLLEILRNRNKILNRSIATKKFLSNFSAKREIKRTNCHFEVRTSANKFQHVARRANYLQIIFSFTL